MSIQLPLYQRLPLPPSPLALPVVNNDDIVPRLSLHNIEKVKVHTLVYACGARLS